MMSSWWVVWIVFMVVSLVPVLGYGWGYRGWGPPFPRYVQRRRGHHAVSMGSTDMFNHQSWGAGGDFVWMVLLIGFLSAGAVYWWQ